jgi:hypothetical protein
VPLSDRPSGRPSGHDRLGTPVAAGAFVIESEPGPDQLPVSAVWWR